MAQLRPRLRFPSTAILWLVLTAVAALLVWALTGDGPTRGERPESGSPPDTPGALMGTRQPESARDLEAATGASDDAPPEQLATLSGFVRDPEGTAVPNATILAIAGDGTPSGRAVSDGRGRFAIDALAPGAWTLTVVAVGFAPHTVERALAPGSVVIDLAPLASLRFELRVPAAAGAPSHAKVSATPLQGGNGTVQMVSGEDGRFAMSDLPLGRVELRIAVAGHPALVVRREVEAGDVVDLGRLDLAEGTRVSGRVVDALGQPVQWMEVRIDGSRRSTYTDADGAFTLDAVPAGVVSVRAVGGLRYLDRAQQVDARADVTSVILQVDRGSLLTGHVTRADGTPEHPPDPSEDASPRPVLYLVFLDSSPPREELLDRDAQGYFVQRLAPGAYRLELRAPAGREVLASQPLDLAEGRDQQVTLAMPSR